MHYIVLQGGISPEREVSIRSGTAVDHALRALGHTTAILDPRDTTLEMIVEHAKHTDGVFPILHGEGGEDGTHQKAFEDAGVPFFGPSRLACESTFDKIVFTRLLEEHGLPVPRWNEVTLESLAGEPLTQTPFVIKPIRGGSSIDTFIVRSLPYDDAPIREALHRYGSMLIQELIDGHETTVGVLDGQALPVIEIIPPTDKEFDYENKYNGATQELCPPVNISLETQEKLQRLAEKVHTVTHGRHLTRTDILLNQAGDFFIIDTNTMPGLTDQSLYPKAARIAGLEWKALVDRFTQLMS